MKYTILFDWAIFKWGEHGAKLNEEKIFFGRDAFLKLFICCIVQSLSLTHLLSRATTRACEPRERERETFKKNYFSDAWWSFTHNTHSFLAIAVKCNCTFFQWDFFIILRNHYHHKKLNFFKSNEFFTDGSFKYNQCQLAWFDGEQIWSEDFWLATHVQPTSHHYDLSNLCVYC